MRRAAFALLLLLLASSASAISLQDLSTGSTLDSGTGLLRFSNFQVLVVGSLDSDLSNYEATAIADGFQLTGPYTMADGFTGQMTLEYDVSLLLGGVLDTATLSFSVVEPILGSLSLLQITEDLLDSIGGAPVPGDSSLQVLGTGSLGVLQDLDIADFVDRTTVSPQTTIFLQANGGDVEITSSEQRFNVIPEPGTALLLGGALAALALRRRRA